MLPFLYTLRNLGREPLRTLQLVLGALAVVFPIMAALAFDSGMRSLLGSTGDPQNIIVLSRDSTESLQRSSIPGESQGEAAAQEGVLATSPEVHLMSPVSTPGGRQGRAYLRGVLPEALAVHRRVQLTAGRFPRAGEVMVGALAAQTLHLPAEELQPGCTLRIGGQDFLISGAFAAPGARYESELWGEKNDVLALTNRDRLSCVVARANAVGARRLEHMAFRRSDLELSALPEPKYYETLGAFFRPIALISWLCALLISAGALFGGFNTLYAAFGTRTKELAALRAIGFSRRSIFCSLIMESLLACLSGTLLACVLAVFVAEGVPIPLSMGTLTLHFGASVLSAGIAAGVALGVLGAAFPAWQCLRTHLALALRSI